MGTRTAVEFYRTRAGWRWRMRDRHNRKIIAAATEGYCRRIDAARNLLRVVNTGAEYAREQP